MIYPDFEFSYTVTVQGSEGAVLVSVDLDRPVPPEYKGKLCFNLELFPGSLFGRPWIMDEKQGVFPRHPNGPLLVCVPNYLHSLADITPDGGLRTDPDRLSEHGGEKYNPIVADDIIAEPYASGRHFTLRPDDPNNRCTVRSESGTLKLYDGRMNHNNGWFVLSEELPAGAAEGAVRWIVAPSMVEGWTYAPVVQVSQVGYHPDQPKTAIVETEEPGSEKAVLCRIQEDGEHPVC